MNIIYLPPSLALIALLCLWGYACILFDAAVYSETWSELGEGAKRGVALPIGALIAGGLAWEYWGIG